LENHKFGQASPLINLANRSVATIAVGFAHLLLLFSQVYLLNCLEVDNLEQRRGKLVKIYLKGFRKRSCLVRFPYILESS